VTGDVALAARILGTAAVFPGPPLTTAQIAREVAVRYTPGELEARTGIHTRHWAEAGALAAPLAAEALRQALAVAGMPPQALARVVYVCSLAGDLIYPATGNKVIHELGLDRRCATFDINNACLGFLSALDVAARSIATGMGAVGIVSAELGSRAIRREDHRPFLICGDAVVATIVGPARPGEGILASHAINDPTFESDAYADHPLVTDQREYLQFRPPSPERALAAERLLDRTLEPVLERARVRLHEVEWVLLHQPTGIWLDAAMKRLGLDPSRVVRVVDAIGSVASACIPAALDRLLRTQPVRAGDRVLMAGVGGGPSAGAVLYRVG
jgi:3-oxoacyl-(acyl-carrier-protein) synthase III